MPTFRCTFVNEDGRFNRREIQADSRAQLLESLATSEEKLISARRLWERQIRLLGRWHRHLKIDDFLLFNQELIALIKSGIPFIRALEIISNNTQNRQLREILDQAALHIRNGTQISDALAVPCLPFYKIYRASIMAGEKSGHLEQVLEKFNSYLARVSDMRRKTISALTYPVMLLVFMSVMVGVIMIYVIPKFSEFYDNFDAALPAITIFFIETANFLKANLPGILAALLGGYAAIRMLEHFSPDRPIIDRYKTRIPFISRIIHENAVAVFSRTMSILISGGIPVPESTDIAVETFANRYYFSQVRAIPENIRQGRALSDVLDEIAIMPRLLVEMTRVGETSGNLPGVLDESADFYERSIDMRIHSLISLIEPVIIVTLGMVIAMMLVSVYLPIFSSIRVIQ